MWNQCVGLRFLSTQIGIFREVESPFWHNVFANIRNLVEFGGFVMRIEAVEMPGVRTNGLRVEEKWERYCDPL